MTHVEENHNKINIRNNEGQKTVKWHNQRAERKKHCPSKILYLAKLSFKKTEGLKKIFPDKQRLGEFIASILLYKKY